jgi:hypothetical protein
MHDTRQGEVDSGSRTNDLPDVLVPEPLPRQYFGRSTPSTPDVPEKRLMFAVLLNAILQLRSRDAQDVVEAEHWIRDHETAVWPFSFSNICEVLGIESTFLARGLLTWRDRPTDAAQRAPLRQVRSSRTRVAPLRERTRRAIGSQASSINEAPPNDTSKARAQT